MCRIQLLRSVAAALVVAAHAYAQDAARFSGKWHGEHQGKLYLILTISAESPLKLTLTTSHIHVDEKGEMTIDGDVENEEKIVEAKIEDGRLLFSTEQQDGIMRYEFRVDSDGSGLLRLVDEAEVKPFRLKRA